MRAGAGAIRLGILGLGAILVATSAWGAGRYDSAYPVCSEVYDDNGSRIECFFTSMEQCKESAGGGGRSCFINPEYAAPPPEPVAAVAEPAPVKPAKPKPTKSAKKPQPPAKQPAPAQ